MSLYYPPLDMESTVEIFRLNLDRIKNRFQKRERNFIVKDIEIGAFVMDYWQQYPEARWNGRQIRNACQTALALAEFEAQGGDHKAVIDHDAVVNLQLKHFQRVADAYLGFMSYIVAGHMGDAQIISRSMLTRLEAKTGASIIAYIISYFPSILYLIYYTLNIYLYIIAVLFAL